MRKGRDLLEMLQGFHGQEKWVMRARTAILRIHADPGVGSFGDSGDFGHRWHQSQEEQQ